MNRNTIKPKAPFIFVIILIVLGSCTSNQKDWKKAKQLNTITGYENFINKYPKSEFIDSANYFIEKLYFQKCLIENTKSIYGDYLRKFPDSKLADSALHKIELLDFQEVISANSDSSYYDFLNNYPESNLTDSVTILLEKLEFDRSVALGSVFNFISFMKKYPKSIYLDELEINQETSITGFKNRYKPKNILKIKTSSSGDYLIAELLIPSGSYVTSDFNPYSGYLVTKGDFDGLSAEKKQRSKNIVELFAEFIEFSPYTSVYIDNSTVLISGETGAKFKRLSNRDILIQEGKLYLFPINKSPKN